MYATVLDCSGGQVGERRFLNVSECGITDMIASSGSSHREARVVDAGEIYKQGETVCSDFHVGGTLVGRCFFFLMNLPTKHLSVAYYVAGGGTIIEGLFWVPKATTFYI